MKRKVVLSICLGIALSYAAIGYGQSTPPPKDATSCAPSTLDSLVGTVSLSLGTDAAVKKAMPCLITLWQRSRSGGGLGLYVSNAFLSVMQENPNAFFLVMSREPRVFEEWVNGLPDLSFTWSGPPPCGLEQKRKQLISLLEHSQLHEAKASLLKQQVTRRLSSIQCRQID